MVYCTKCGTKNSDDAKYCIECGADLEGFREISLERRAEEWGEEFGRRMEEWGKEFERQVKEECFGLPHGGAIVGLIIGIIIILVGLSWLTGIVWEGFWPLVVIIFGILVLAGAIYGLRRRS